MDTIKRAGSVGLGIMILAAMFLFNCNSHGIKDGNFEISVDSVKELLTVQHRMLGSVLKEVRPALELGYGIVESTGWDVRISSTGIRLETQQPEAVSWEFDLKDGAIDLRCSDPRGVLTGKAPADENRIPVRLEEQDNGILMTSLGRISSRNVYCLFDRNTDTVIRFQRRSRLNRHVQDDAWMEVIIPIEGSEPEISLIENYFVKVLGLKSYKPRPQRFETAPVAWSSWYCYYMGTTEQDMITETDALAVHLKPFGLEYVQLDACYERGDEANWLEWNKESFPRGGKWLFDYIRSRGLKPALWVNAYGSNYAKAEMADRYPDEYYLRDKQGKLSGACCTADTTEVRLDYTNPEVIKKHLKPLFEVLVKDWGLKYLKDAGWGTWMDYYEANKSMAHDSTRDSREVYMDVQNAIRETVGEDFYIGGCAMHEVDLGFGVFDGSRIGGDDKAVWYPEERGGMSMQTFFHSIFGANYLHNIVWHCDPDAAMVRNPLTLEEGRTVVSAIALTGQLFMASDFMNKLPQKKLELYQKTMPTTPIVPVDLYPYRIDSNKRDGIVWCCPSVKEFPRAIDLKVNGISGEYDVLAVFNWTDRRAERSISFGKDLGLNEHGKYLVFDFWKEEFLGEKSEGIKIEIPSHGTRILVIRPAEERPQFLADSRHITGTVSLQNLVWDEGSMSGVSKVVSGYPHSIFISVPDGYTVKDVKADAEMMFYKTAGRLLEVKFSGMALVDGKNINWAVKFE